jgi:hypothetical protein
MVWALVHHPTDHKSVFAGFGNVARGHASGAGGAGDLMISRDQGDSWEGSSRRARVRRRSLQ